MAETVSSPATGMITAPGIYPLPAAAYHADPCPEPSLSCSIAKRIIQASAAHARHEHPRLNPDAQSETGEHFDIGTVAHALLLEGESGVAVLDYPDWRTSASKDARDQARAAGKTPLLRKVWTEVEAMIGAAREQLARHTDGGAEMFTAGEPERTLIWRDDEFGGLWCRARLDWLRPVTTAAPGWAIDDYKSTSASANPDDWTRTMYSCAFDLQVAWYLRGLKALFPAVDATFRFAVQETYPPYALSVITLGPDAMTLAEKKCLYALDVWASSLKKNDWRGYPRRTCYATLPPWHEAQWLEKELR